MTAAEKCARCADGIRPLGNPCACPRGRELAAWFRAFVAKYAAIALEEGR